MATTRDVYQRRLYATGADPADRFFGSPCGCVFVARRFTKYPDDVMVQVDDFYEHVVGGQDCDRMNGVSSSVYYYTPVFTGQDEGFRWQ